MKKEIKKIESMNVGNSYHSSESAIQYFSNELKNLPLQKAELKKKDRLISAKNSCEIEICKKVFGSSLKTDEIRRTMSDADLQSFLCGEKLRKHYESGRGRQTRREETNGFETLEKYANSCLVEFDNDASRNGLLGVFAKIRKQTKLMKFYKQICENLHDTGAINWEAHWRFCSKIAFKKHNEVFGFENKKVN